MSKHEINEIDSKKDPRRNASGYMDLTAYEALRNIEREEEAEERFKKLLTTIFTICDLAGFRIEERLIIRDKKTGKVWR